MSPTALLWLGLVPLAVGFAGILVTIVAADEVGRWTRVLRIVGGILAVIGTALIFLAFQRAR